MNTTEFVNAILAARTASTAALQRALPDVQAMDPSEVRSINVDAPSAVARVLGALPKILALRADIADALPAFDMSKLDKLQDYACALQEAHVQSLSAGKTPDELRALGEEGDSLRTVLRTDAAALVARGLIDPARLESCNGQPGYKTIATDLGILASVMLSCWPAIVGKSGTTEDELHRAEAIAEAILAYVGIHDQSPEAKAAATDVRNRAFTLLVHTYEESRRAVQYLRFWEGDADDLAPSMYEKHRGKQGQNGGQKPASAGSPADAPAQAPAAASVATAAMPAAAPVNVARVLETPAVNVMGRPTTGPFMQ
jgi:hypothetical protein